MKTLGRTSLSALGAAVLLGQGPSAWAEVVTVPPGLNPGDPYRLVFVTSTVRDATAQDIGTYNSFVSAVAATVPELNGLGATWAAIGSSGNRGTGVYVNADANTLTRAGDPSAPIYRLDGTLVAIDNIDLWDGSIAAAISIDETGELFETQVWTGTRDTGVRAGDWFLGDTGGGWVYYGLSTGTAGGGGGSAWVDNLGEQKTSAKSFYALSDILTVPVGSEKEVISFMIGESAGVVDADNFTVEVEVPFGADVTALTPTVVVSAGATVAPASGETVNFTNPVTYTVTAQDSSTQDYEVTVSVTPASSAKEFLAFEWNGFPATITGTDILLNVAPGTDVTMLAPVMTVSDFATVSPESGTVVDFSNPVTYLITAQDGSTQEYTVTVVVGTGPSSLVYESMFYPAGAGQLHGQMADAGLAEWAVNPAGAGQIVGPGMAYTDAGGKSLPVAGNRYETVAGFNDLARAAIDPGPWSTGNKEGGKLNTKGATIWFSALMKAQASVHNHFHLDFTDTGNGNASWANGPGYVAVGKTTSNGNWEVRADNDDGDADVMATSSVSATEETFILGRIVTDETSGNSTVDVWFNALLDTEPGGPGTGDISLTLEANDDGSVTQFDTVGYRHQKWESPNLLDEIRMGESYAQVVGAAGASGPVLTIEAKGSDLVFSWDSRAGKVYDLLSATDLGSAPGTWPVWGGYQDLPATPDLNELTIPRPADGTRFFVVAERKAPPVVLLWENFDGADPGWATGASTPPDTGTTAWQLGNPTGGAASGPPAAHSPNNCYGTNLAADYGFNTDIWLRTPPIDLSTASGATLVFRQFRDIETGFDNGSIRILKAAADSQLGADLLNPTDGTSAAWEEVTVDLPAAALGETIKIEFRFESDLEINQAGWYIDDVLVTKD